MEEIKERRHDPARLYRARGQIRTFKGFSISGQNKEPISIYSGPPLHWREPWRPVSYTSFYIFESSTSSTAPSTPTTTPQTPKAYISLMGYEVRYIITAFNNYRSLQYPLLFIIHPEAFSRWIYALIPVVFTLSFLRVINFPNP